MQVVVGRLKHVSFTSGVVDARNRGKKYRWHGKVTGEMLNVFRFCFFRAHPQSAQFQSFKLPIAKPTPFPSCFNYLWLKAVSARLYNFKMFCPMIIFFKYLLQFLSPQVGLPEWPPNFTLSEHRDKDEKNCLGGPWYVEHREPGSPARAPNPADGALKYAAGGRPNRSGGRFV